MWHLIWVLLIKTVLSDDQSDTYPLTDQCLNICKDFLPSLEYNEQLMCEKGCRFFCVIHFKNDENLDESIKKCHSSCEESYSKNSTICVQGCNLIHNEYETQFIFLLIREEKVVLAQPETDDFLTDPSIKNQLDINVDYKIPETYIRTMPIEKIQDNSGDWLDCASRNSGIPRRIILAVILAGVLLALWLSFSTLDKNQENDDEKLILANDDKDVYSKAETGKL